MRYLAFVGAMALPSRPVVDVDRCDVLCMSQCCLAAISRAGTTGDFAEPIGPRYIRSGQATLRLLKH